MGSAFVIPSKDISRTPGQESVALLEGLPVLPIVEEDQEQTIVGIIVCTLIHGELVPLVTIEVHGEDLSWCFVVAIEIYRIRS